MKRIAITGGIGSGKSYVCRLLALRGIEVYDCDAAAKRLMRTSDDLRRRLTALIGPEAYSKESGEKGTEWVLNKGAVARFLTASAENARAVDAIVHPAVERDFMASGIAWIESAILYQAGFDRLVDRVVVVTAPEEVRVERVMRRDGISRAKALEWLALQMPQEEVRRRADFEIVNDGQHDLAPQIEHIINNI